MRLFAIAAAVVILGGCASTKLADTSCKSFKPIAASSKDTTPTKRQVVEHNKVFDAICPEKG